MSARVLVVDDVAVNRRLLEAKLAAEYYEVTVAASGAAILRARNMQESPNEVRSTLASLPNIGK